MFVVFFVQYMASFKAFMMEIGAENVLLAFNNLQDIYEYLSVLNVSPDVSDEMRSVLCCGVQDSFYKWLILFLFLRVLNYLELVHSFYKNYMSTGSEFKIPLSVATVSDFLHISSQTVKVDCEVCLAIAELTGVMLMYLMVRCCGLWRRTYTS